MKSWLRSTNRQLWSLLAIYRNWWLYKINSLNYLHSTEYVRNISNNLLQLKYCRNIFVKYCKIFYRNFTIFPFWTIFLRNKYLILLELFPQFYLTQENMTVIFASTQANFIDFYGELLKTLFDFKFTLNVVKNKDVTLR